MPGPYSPDHHLGADGPPLSDPHPNRPTYPGSPANETVQAAPAAAAYPGMLPPPVAYPKRRGRRLILAALAAVIVLAALITAIVRGVHHGPPISGAFSDATAKTAIQGYLDALEHRDTETIARNSLCGIYDAVRDRRSDQALAKLSSDAFRKQFTEAQVTSIDKIVYWSAYQAQVLFTMRVAPSAGGDHEQIQGIAQLLNQHNQVLVCSYVQRTAGTY
jgi:hypothetical protein